MIYAKFPIENDDQEKKIVDFISFIGILELKVQVGTLSGAQINLGKNMVYQCTIEHRFRGYTI